MFKIHEKLEVNCIKELARVSILISFSSSLSLSLSLWFILSVCRYICLTRCLSACLSLSHHHLVSLSHSLSLSHTRSHAHIPDAEDAAEGLDELLLLHVEDALNVRRQQHHDH